MAHYWLFKSEPDEYSIEDLANEEQGFGCWDGIRNYQARNFLRDKVKLGDKVFFYHSSCKVPAIAGTAKVVREAYPDPFQFEPEHKYFDAKSTSENPRWFCVDIAMDNIFKKPVPLKLLKQHEALKDMVLLNQGRLSIQPVSEEQWQYVMMLANQEVL